MASFLLCLFAVVFFLLSSVAPLIDCAESNVDGKSLSSVLTTNLTIYAHYPTSQLQRGDTLYIRGSTAGLNWNSGVQMNYTGNNTWSFFLSYPVLQYSEQILQFKTLVNDQTWSVGANFMIVLEEDASYVNIYPWFYSGQGQYSVLPTEFYDKQFNNSRKIVVYTPPSYYENTLKTIENVLIMHDGENLFNASTSFSGVAWNCQTTINDLVVAGTIDEVLIVGVYNTLNRINEYTYSYDPQCECPNGAGGQGDLYLNLLSEQIIPFVRANYRVGTGVENLAILGSSLGGLISCYAGWTRSSEYSMTGCMSSSFWWNNEDFDRLIINASMPQYPIKIYLDSGNAGPDQDDVNQTRTVRNHLENVGFILGENLYYYLQIGGQHSEYYWGKRFHVPMTYFYKTKLLAPQIPL